MNTIRPILICACLLVLSAAAARGAVLTVTNTNDSGSGSLRQAILDANVNNSNDTINFDPAVFNVSRVILLTTGELVIGPDNSDGTVRSLTINGSGANLLEINGNDHSRIFRVANQGIAIINRVKLSGGNGTSNGENPNLNGVGGAIVAEAGNPFGTYNLTLIDSIVTGNRATLNNGAGGGIQAYGQTLIINSAIVNNTTVFYGGGISSSGELWLVNTTVSKNSGGLTGGIYQSGGNLHLINADVVLNLATGVNATVGGIILASGPFTITNCITRNSIIANNSALSPFAKDVDGRVQSDGNNIFGLGFNIGNPPPTDLFAVDPQIDIALSTNGGIIPSHALSAGSPAIDSGNNCVLMTTASGGCSPVAIVADHRGVVRPQDANSDGSAIVDRGTFEATAAEVAGAPGTPDLDAADDSGISNTDNITSASQLTIQIGSLITGATVEVSRNGIVVSSSVASSTSMTYDDNLSTAGTYVYSVRQIVSGVPSLSGGALRVVFDNVAPTGTLVQAAGQADPTRFQPINFTATFSENVIGFDAADLTFAGSTANTGSAVVNVTGTAPTYSLAVSNITADGAVVLGVSAGVVQDLAGNTNVAFGGPDNSVTLDTIAPSVTINQAAGQLDPARLLPINFTVVFSEPVTGFATSDVSLAGSTANVASATRTITGTGPTYNVAISGVFANGATVIASIPALAVQDAAGNTSVASTSVDNSVTLDNLAPTVTVNQAVGQADPTNVLPINFTVTFSEVVTGFDSADILFTGSSVNTSAASISISGTGPTYTVSIGNLTANSGQLRVTVRVGAATDAIGNQSLVSTSSDNSVTFDNIAPVVTVNQASNQADPSLTQPIRFTLVFSEPVFGFQPSDVSFGGSTANVSTASVQITGSGTVYTITVGNITSNGQVRVSIPSGAVVDNVGNPNAVSTSTDNTVTVIVRSSPFDFDGDGKTDIGIFRPTGGEWWVNRSGDGQTFALQFGASTDKIVPADYTGDGKADIAVFRPSSGEWYVLRSDDFSFFALPFGTNGDVPVPADYDADGKADFAVFRPSSSTWFISQSSGAPTRIVQFGTSGDQPVVADYDGDRKADIGIFRQAAAGAEWWIDRSTAGSLAMQFGASTDKAVQGDYTGDGKADIAIWKPSTGEWFIVRSEDFSFYGFPFGSTGDIVAPGDYDGDGKFDVTVFRPSSATWFISRTTAGTQIVPFGSTGDRPLPNAFVP